jgi:DNA replicative helicase MCM subunit Mcm2 (Cdc46/Mcm family)
VFKELYGMHLLQIFGVLIQVVVPCMFASASVFACTSCGHLVAP